MAMPGGSWPSMEPVGGLGVEDQVDVGAEVEPVGRLGAGHHTSGKDRRQFDPGAVGHLGAEARGAVGGGQEGNGCCRSPSVEDEGQQSRESRGHGGLTGGGRRGAAETTWFRWGSMARGSWG